jgi:hypothetical protein
MNGKDFDQLIATVREADKIRRGGMKRARGFGSRRPYIPHDAEWYLADLILEHTIQGDRRNVVHINTHLIKAKSPQQAYEKAIRLGRSKQLTYVNTEGKRVRVRFRGLRNLNVIHEPLEDGAELTFEEEIGISKRQLRLWTTAKKKLSVFAPPARRNDIPNYFPQVAMDLLERSLS